MKWVKIFGGKWSFFTFSILADIHGRIFKKIFGVGPEPILFTVKNGFSSFYYTKQGLEKFRIKLSELVKNNPFIVESMYKESLLIAKKIDKLTLKRKVNSKDVKELISLLYEFVPSYVFLKQCLEKYDDKNRYLGLCEDSRKKTELLWYQVEDFFLRFTKNNKLLTFCSLDEMCKFFKNNELPINLIERKKSLMIQDHDKKIIRCGEEVDKFEKSLYSKIKFLKGKIAYPGKVRGKARIILDPNSVKNFNKGDILVTQMTRPDYLPFMIKAGAVITDAGGQLCHAAIIAREIKKCTLIGTNIATKFLMEGDLIEIKNNVVKKIEEH